MLKLRLGFKLAISLCLISLPLIGVADDPYRWMEDPQSEELKAWIADQQEHTREYFSDCVEQDDLEKRLEEIGNFESWSLPQVSSRGLYFQRRVPGEESHSLVFRANNGREEVLFSPDDENHLTLSGFVGDSSGRKVAYGISKAGEDHQVWVIFNRRKGICLPEVIKGIKFSPPIWSPNGLHLYYVSDLRSIYRHKVGTSAEEDEEVYRLPEEEGGMLGDLSIDCSGRLLTFSHHLETERTNTILRLDLSSRSHSAEVLIPSGLGVHGAVGEVNKKLLFITDFNAPYRQLIALDPVNPGFESPLISEEGEVLADAVITESKIICLFYTAAIANVKIYDLEGRFLEKLPVQGKGRLGISGDKRSPFLFYSYTDYSTPPTLYKVNLKTMAQTIFHQPHTPLPNVITRQVWYESYDGTKVPMFVSHREDLTISEETPVLLYGYGGFCHSMTPFYFPFFVGWMEQGGVLAVANLRGGYEFGKEWYESGRLHRKQNTFDDFMSGAEWLIANQIGSTETLGIYGVSNGGLLTAACLAQRPDLFGAVIVDKGVLDMTRFHLFTSGFMWQSDYGSPDNPADYVYLLSYSPYHNLNKTSYPPTLVNTADHDDRVVPAHSYKFTAALQEAQQGNAPILLSIRENLGHGVGSCSQLFSSSRDFILFLQKELSRNQGQLQ